VCGWIPIHLAQRRGFIWNFPSESIGFGLFGEFSSNNKLSGKGAAETVTKDSESFFSRTLDQKTDEARKAVDECIKQYLSHNPKKRDSAAQTAFAAVDRIFQLLHSNDHPAWLPLLHRDLNFAKNHSQDNNGVVAVLRIASELYPQLLNHQWNVGTSESASGFDFDAIYEKYRAECRISDLFDELIKNLKEIVASDAIDSVTALRELNKVIATLHSARKGSYFATRGAWYFVATWFKNTGWELLGTIPVAGSVVKGLQKTFEEGDVKMKALHDNIQSDFETQIASDFPRLEYRAPALPAIEGPTDDPDANSENTK